MTYHICGGSRPLSNLATVDDPSKCSICGASFSGTPDDSLTQPPAPETALEKFERLAAAFERQTGMLAPGKDQPMAGNHHTDEERGFAWRRFIENETPLPHPVPSPIPTGTLDAETLDDETRQFPPYSDEARSGMVADANRAIMNFDPLNADEAQRPWFWRAVRVLRWQATLESQLSAATERNEVLAKERDDLIAKVEARDAVARLLEQTIDCLLANQQRAESALTTLCDTLEKLPTMPSDHEDDDEPTIQVCDHAVVRSACLLAREGMKP